MLSFLVISLQTHRSQCTMRADVVEVRLGQAQLDVRGRSPGFARAGGRSRLFLVESANRESVLRVALYQRYRARSTRVGSSQWRSGRRMGSVARDVAADATGSVPGQDTAAAAAGVVSLRRLSFSQGR